MKSLFTLFACALLFACANTGSDSKSAQPAPLAPTGSGDDYVFVWLKTGPAYHLNQAELADVSAGHFANMARLAKEEFLLLAGPVGDPKANPLHRGIFLFDVDQVAKAKRLTATDPGVQSGVFVFEALPFRTSQPLRDLLALDRQAGDARANMRSYVLATAVDPEFAELSLIPFAGEGLVALSGRVGKPGEERGLYVLAIDTVQEAREMLELIEPSERLEWQLSSLYGSKSLQALGE